MDDFLSTIAKLTGNKSLVSEPKIDVNPILDRMRDSVVTRESGGRQKIKNPRTGATGLFQVLPSNIPDWTQKYFGKRLTPEQYASSPAAQEKVFRGEMGRYLEKALRTSPDEDTAIRKAAAAWYGGEGAMHRYDDPKRFRPDEPSFQEYTNSILSRLKQKPQTDTPDFLSSLQDLTKDLGGEDFLSRIQKIAPSPTNPVSPPKVSIPAPEAPETINAQIQSTLDPNSPKKGTLLTPGEQIPTLGGLQVIDIPEGKLAVNPAKGQPRSLAEAIGKVQDVGSNTRGMTVLTTDAQGNELSASIVRDPKAAAEQVKLDKQMYPQAVNHELLSSDEVARRRNEQLARSLPSSLMLPNGQPPIQESEEPVIGGEVSPAAPRQGIKASKPQQVAGQAEAQIGEDNGFDAIVNPSEGDNSFTSIKDQAAAQLAKYAQVEYDTARQYVDQMNLQGLSGGKYDPNARLDPSLADSLKGRQISINFTPVDIKRVQAFNADVARRKAQSELDLARREKGINQDELDAAGLELEQFRLKTLADADNGLITHAQAAEAYEKLKADIDAWRQDTGILGNEEDVATQKAGLENAASFLGENLASSQAMQPFGQGERKGTPDIKKVTPQQVKAYRDQAYNDIKQQYGSISNYVEQGKAFAKRMENKPMFAIAKGVETAAGGLAKVPFEATAALLKASAIGEEAVGRLFGADIDAQKDWRYKLGQDIKDLSESIPIDKDFKGSIPEILGNTTGQVVLQALVGAPTGGVGSFLIGGTMGGVDAYEQAKKGGATPWQALGATAAAGLLAVPDIFIFGGEKIAPFLRSFKTRIVEGLVARGIMKEAAEKAAITATNGFFDTLIEKQGLKKVIGYAGKNVKTGTFEMGQEVSENIGNHAYAYLTYDPTPERWNKLTDLFSKENIISGVAGFFGGLVGAGLAELSTRAQNLSPEAVAQAQELLPKFQPYLSAQDFANAKKALTTVNETKAPTPQKSAPVAQTPLAKDTPVESKAEPKSVESLLKYYEEAPTDLIPEAPLRPSTLEGAKNRIKEVETQLEEERRKGNTDKLTGLANQNAWEAAKERIESDPEQEVISIDVNRMKDVNDTTSHEGVNKTVLKPIGDAVQKVLTKHGIDSRNGFRTGGDEFTIAVPKGKAQQVRDDIEKAFGVVNVTAEKDFTNTRTGESFKKGDVIPVTISGSFGNTVKEAEVELGKRKEESKGKNPVQRARTMKRPGGELVGESKPRIPKKTILIPAKDRKKYVKAGLTDAEVQEQVSTPEFQKAEELSKKQKEDKTGFTPAQKQYLARELENYAEATVDIPIDELNDGYIAAIPMDSIPKQVSTGLSPNGGSGTRIDGGWMETTLKGQTAFSEGHIILVGSEPFGKGVSERKVNGDDAIGNEKTFKDVEPVRAVSIGKGRGVVVEFSDGQVIPFEQYNLVKSRFPTVSFKSRKDMIAFYDEGKLIGAAMTVKNPQVDESPTSLEMPADTGDFALQKDARQAHPQDLMDRAKTSITKDGHIELNVEAGELLRRIARKPNSFFGLTHTRGTLIQLSRRIDQKIDEFKKAGYTDSQLTVLSDMSGQLKEVAKNGAGVTYIFDFALPHETHHQMVLNALGDNVLPKETIDELSKLSVWKNPKVTQPTGQSSTFSALYPRASGVTKAMEIAAMLDTGEIQSKDKERFLQIFAQGIKQASPEINTADFARIFQYDSTPSNARGDTETESTSEADRGTGEDSEAEPPQAESEAGTRPGDRGLQRPDSGAATETREKVNRTLAEYDGLFKKRQYAETLRENGYEDTPDVPYIPDTEKKWLADAQRRISASKHDDYKTAEKAFYEDNMEPQQRTALGIGLLDHLGSIGELERMIKVSEELVKHVGTAAQALRASQLAGKYDFVTGMMIATRAVKKAGKELTAKDAEKVRELLTRIAQTEEEKASLTYLNQELETAVKEADKNIKELEGALTEAQAERKVDEKTIAKLKRQIATLKENRPRTYHAKQKAELERAKPDLEKILGEAFSLAMPSGESLEMPADDRVHNALVDMASLDILNYVSPEDTIEHLRDLTNNMLSEDELREIHLEAFEATKTESNITPEARKNSAIRMAHRRMAMQTAKPDVQKVRERPSRYDKEVITFGRDNGYTDKEILGAILMPKIKGAHAVSEWKKLVDGDDDTFKRSRELRQKVNNDIQDQIIKAKADREGYKGDLEKFKNEVIHNGIAGREARKAFDNYARKLGRSLGRKAFDFASETVSLFKGLSAWGEISYIGRQGFIPLLTDTRAAIKGDWKGVGHGLQGDNQLWQYLADKAGFENAAEYLSNHSLSVFVEQIRQHPRFLSAQNNGVRFTHIGDFNVADDHFSTQLLEKVPFYRRAEVAYTLPGDLQRLYIYDNWATMLEQQNLSADEMKKALKYVAETVNAFTGKGDIGKVIAKGGALSKALNLALFSPQLLFSRFQSLNKLTLGWATAPKGLKMQMAKKGLRFYGILAVIAALTGMVLDPEDEDFGKINKGDTHLDILAGLDVPAQLYLRTAMGFVKSVINQDTAYLADDIQANIREFGVSKEGQPRFVRSKLSPGASLAVDAYTGTDFIGRPFTWWGGLTSRSVPLAWQQTYDALLYDRYREMVKEPRTFEYAVNKFNENERNYLNALMVMAGTFTGIGVTQYPKADRSKAVQLAAQLSPFVSKKDAEQRRIEGGLRNLLADKFDLLKQGKDTRKVDAEIERWMRINPDLNKKFSAINTQANSKYGLLSLYLKDLNADQLKRVRSVSTDPGEIEIIDKRIKTLEK